MTRPADFDIAEFVKERDKILPTLDEAKIRGFYASYGEQLPADPEVFWGSVHKAITAIKALPIETRKASKKWLDERGWASQDDGDLS